MLQTSSKAPRCAVSKTTRKIVTKASLIDDISCHGVTASKWSTKQTDAAFHAAKIRQKQENSNV